MHNEQDRDNPAAPAHRAAMDGYWQAVGLIEPEVISYLVNPMFMGAPAWPNTRQAYRVVRTADTVIIASDGLADPQGRDGQSAPGFGCEVFIETPELVGVDFDRIQASPYFRVIELFAQNVAANQGISAVLREYGVLSMELPVGLQPGPMVGGDGAVGCLIGLPTGRPAVAPTPLGAVDVIALTVIAPAELDRIMAGGAAARRQLAAERTATAAGHRSFLAAPAR